MRFGLFGGARQVNGVAASGDSSGYREFIDYVLAAEDLGFSSVFVVEHHFTGLGQISSSLELLTFIAARTSTIRLGTAVTVLPWHNPVLLAEQVATLDVLSDGRLDLGVGRGYRPNEFHGFAIDQADAQERYEEVLEVLLRSMASEERFSHTGRHWRFQDIVVEPRSVQRPHPPIWIGAGSERSVRKAGADGHSLLLDQFSDAEAIGERIGWYREAVEAEGRTFDPNDVGVTRALLLVDDDRLDQLESEYELRMNGIRTLRESSQAPGQELSADDHLFYNDTRRATERAAIAGTAETCIERIRELEAAGAANLLFNDPVGGIDRLKQFSRDVMPAFG